MQKKICVICIICEISEPSRFKFVGICKICGTRKRKEDSERLPPVFKSPEEMPCPEDRLTQSLSRIISHEVHISPYLQEILLSHSLLCEMPILGEVPYEVATIQYLCQQQLSSLFIHRSYHLPI